MSDVLVREGYLSASRRRKLDADKNPIGEWSDWSFASATGSGYYSYLFSSAGKTGRSQKELSKVTQHPMYSNDGQPERPAEIHYQLRPAYNAPEYAAFQEKVDAFQNLYKSWHDARPITGYNEQEHRAIPGKMVMDSEDAR